MAIGVVSPFRLPDWVVPGAKFYEPTFTYDGPVVLKWEVRCVVDDFVAVCRRRCGSRWDYQIRDGVFFDVYGSKSDLRKPPARGAATCDGEG